MKSALEGLYAGGSSGAAVAGAVKYARQVGKPHTIVVLLPDGAAKYLSKLFNDEWLRENSFLEDEWGLGTVADLLEDREIAVVTAAPTERIREVITKMKAHGISQLPVVDAGRLVGAVSEVDLLRYLASGEHSPESDVAALVESEYATVSPQTRVELVQGLLADARMALVLENDAIVGIITKMDLIDYLARPRRRTPRRRS